MFDKSISRHKNINKNTVDNYDNEQVRKYQVIKPVSDSFKISTQKLHLNIDYDLPLTQLQYTKTRKYKQNLNPIFQLLSTNNHRYNHNNHQIPQKLNKSQNSRYKFNYEKNEKEHKLKSQIDSKFIYERNKRILSYESTIQPVSQLKESKDYQIHKNKKFIDQNLRKEQKFVKSDQLLQPQYKPECQIQRILSSQIASQLLKQIQSKKNDILVQIEESKQRLSVLRQKVSMLKQKNIIKDRQIYLNYQQKQRQQIKLKNLQKSLKKSIQLKKDYEMQHHEIFKKLKNVKKQIKKQEKWLQEQNSGIEKIKKQIQFLLKEMRSLEQQQEERQSLIKQIKQQQQLNKELKIQIQDGNSHLIALKQQLQLLQEQTQTLQTHQNQLNNLQLKFKTQTQKLKQNLHQIQSQFQQKNNLISQQSQIDSILKDLQLQIGQMNQQKIILQQHIQQTHLKISIKNNNIKHIKNLQTQKYYHQPQKKSTSISPSIFPKNTNPDTKKLSKSISLHPKNQALPTIRQQSKNTSLYQTPKNQQVFITQQNQQQSHHPFSSNSLQIDSQQPSRTQIFKPHLGKNQRQLKKYFVIQSQQDGASNNKSLYGLRKTDDFFINNKNTSSIEQKIQDRNHTKTQNEEVYQLEKSNDFHFKSNNKEISLERSDNIRKKDKSRQKKSYQNLQQSVDNESQQAFQTLIQRFEQIKSNSYFDESWRQKI